jgi:hypothetical protein
VSAASTSTIEAVVDEAMPELAEYSVDIILKALFLFTRGLGLSPGPNGNDNGCEGRVLCYFLDKP